MSAAISTVTRAHGFAHIKRDHPELYRAIRNHIAVCFDRFDWGYLHSNGKSKPRANKKENLNIWLDSRVHRSVKRHLKAPRTLSLRKLESHCQNLSTIYTTSHPSSGFAVLLVDIDDKDGSAGDAPQTFDLMHRLFARANGDSIVGQTSTFGRGHHGFVVVDYRGMSTKAFRVLCRRLERALSTAASDHCMRSKVELMGVPGLLLSYGGYQTMGSLAKFPRLETTEAWKDYLSRPTYCPAELEALVSSHYRELPSLSLPSTQRDMGTSIITLETPVPISLCERREQREGFEGLDPKQRMNRVARDLSRAIKRPTTALECLTRYESLGLHTGVDRDGNRWKLAQEAAEWVARTWDASKGEGYSARRKELLGLIGRHVTPSMRETVKFTNRTQYSDEQLAVTLYGIELSATNSNKRPDLQATAPNNSLVAMFKTLNIHLDANPETARKKLKAMKDILILSGLIEPLRDGQWGTGKGKAFHLGNNHPCRAQNIPLQESIDIEQGINWLT